MSSHMSDWGATLMREPVAQYIGDIQESIYHLTLISVAPLNSIIFADLKHKFFLGFLQHQVYLYLGFNGVDYTSFLWLSVESEKQESDDQNDSSVTDTRETEGHGLGVSHGTPE